MLERLCLALNKEQPGLVGQEEFGVVAREQFVTGLLEDQGVLALLRCDLVTPLTVSFAPPRVPPETRETPDRPHGGWLQDQLGQVNFMKSRTQSPGTKIQGEEGGRSVRTCAEISG